MDNGHGYQKLVKEFFVLTRELSDLWCMKNNQVFWKLLTNFYKHDQSLTFVPVACLSSIV